MQKVVFLFFFYSFLLRENVLSRAGRKRVIYVIYSMRIQYTLSQRIVAQIKPKSSNTFCSKALTWRNSTNTNASSPLTNGAPHRRWSRSGVVLRCPRNIFRCQISLFLWVVANNVLPCPNTEPKKKKKRTQAQI